MGVNIIGALKGGVTSLITSGGNPSAAAAGAVAGAAGGGASAGSKTKYSPTLAQSDISWMYDNMTPDQKAWLQARWNEVPRKTPLPFPTSDATAFYSAYSGGSDHVVSTQAGVAFAQNVESLFATMHSQSQATAATNPPVHASLPGVKSLLSDVINNIKHTATNILGATAAGAAEGARDASQGAASGSAAGAVLSNTKATLTMIFVIGLIAAFVWWMIHRRKHKG